MQEPSVKSNPVHVQIALSIAVFLVPFMGSSLNLAMPSIGADFTMSAFSLTFIVSGYLVGTSMFQMPAARVSDILGRRRMFIAGLSLFGAFTLMSGLAWSGTALIVFRFLSGVGSAFVFATNMAILTSVFP
ncbi:MAG: MFS transporter, partial [Planctomycetes bacterium]|nr:MFS transporter [Planctomycetota bacterium]